MRVATGSTEIATGSSTGRDRHVALGRQIATGLALCRDQIATECSIAMALVNAAYRAVAFTGSAPEPDRGRT
ncbi:hypothetical protein Taro_044548 [Colocasia esculenta]|uniref:Uncharacterized protein n=1 Tax=Colocasia esculenta TaxID=4460 RepID=A0A843X5K7_COLES|nr:hypothetical protein [Colocasia esculenta]